MDVSDNRRGAARKTARLFETCGIQPWQTSVSIHTHPAGVERPSRTDEETVCESFGTWDFVVMIIRTKGGPFYACVDFSHDFGPPETGLRQHFNVQCEVEALWTEASDQPIGRETLAAWGKKLKELVRETPPLTSASSVEPSSRGPQLRAGIVGRQSVSRGFFATKPTNPMYAAATKPQAR